MCVQGRVCVFYIRADTREAYKLKDELVFLPLWREKVKAGADFQK